MDLLFAISTTATESGANMAYTKEIINKIIDKYGIKKLKYSFLTFGQKPLVHFKFSISYGTSLLKLALKRVKMRSRGVSLENAMREAKKVFDEAKGW